MVFRFGDEKVLLNRTAAAQFAGQMLMRGTMKHTRQQLRDEIDKLKAQLNVTGSPTNTSASIQTTRQNLPAILALAGEIFREPAFSARTDPTTISRDTPGRRPGPETLRALARRSNHVPLR